jgi:hypothetical protein
MPGGMLPIPRPVVSLELDAEVRVPRLQHVGVQAASHLLEDGGGGRIGGETMLLVRIALEVVELFGNTRPRP